MAKNTLPTNFKDDILNSSMGGKRRYKLINNSDGTVSLEDASAYDQVGSEYGASQVNAANTAVNASADAGKIVDDIDDIGAITEEGYMAGALALKSVNNSLNVRYNPETDYIQVKSDGQWVDYKKVGLLGLIIFEDGVIYGGSFIQGSDRGMSYTLSSSNLVVSRPQSTYGTLLTNGMLNLSNYSKITIVVEKLYNIGTGKLCVGLTKDITAKDNSFVNKIDISTTGTHEINVSSIDDSYYFIMGISGSTGSSITISKIIVE